MFTVLDGVLKQHRIHGNHSRGRVVTLQLGLQERLQNRHVHNVHIAGLPEAGLWTQEVP